MDIKPNSMAQQMQPRRSNKALWVVLILLVVIVVVGVLAFMFKDKIMPGKAVGESEFQTVFLSNGQVYFGKLSQHGDWATLTNVYYLQLDENLQAAGNDASGAPTGTAAPKNSDIKLVKLGSELHGPTDAMHIKTSNILFWEDMKSDSKVLQAIKQSQNQ
jgi:hypothetical protein